ncbi:MAG: hypothetical protein VKK04_11955 [Synechococcales bacterium]|nr:hypothetical protein [Synechococcales bacterium]
MSLYLRECGDIQSTGLLTEKRREKAAALLAFLSEFSDQYQTYQGVILEPSLNYICDFIQNRSTPEAAKKFIDQLQAKGIQIPDRAFNKLLCRGGEPLKNSHPDAIFQQEFQALLTNRVQVLISQSPHRYSPISQLGNYRGTTVKIFTIEDFLDFLKQSTLARYRRASRSPVASENLRQSSTSTHSAQPEEATGRDRPTRLPSERDSLSFLEAIATLLSVLSTYAAFKHWAEPAPKLARGPSAPPPTGEAQPSVYELGALAAALLLALELGADLERDANRQRNQAIAPAIQIQSSASASYPAAIILDAVTVLDDFLKLIKPLHLSFHQTQGLPGLGFSLDGLGDLETDSDRPLPSTTLNVSGISPPGAGQWVPRPTVGAQLGPTGLILPLPLVVLPDALPDILNGLPDGQGGDRPNRGTQRPDPNRPEADEPPPDETGEDAEMRNPDPLNEPTLQLPDHPPFGNDGEPANGTEDSTGEGNSGKPGDRPSPPLDISPPQPSNPDNGGVPPTETAPSNPDEDSTDGATDGAANLPPEPVIEVPITVPGPVEPPIIVPVPDGDGEVVLSLDGSVGKNQFAIEAGSDRVEITNFGGVGEGASISARHRHQVDTLVFDTNLFPANLGENWDPVRNLIITPVGDDLVITFEEISDIEIVLKGFNLTELDNLPGNGAAVGNIAFADLSSFEIVDHAIAPGDAGRILIEDSFDVFNADWAEGVRSEVFQPEHVTFLNEERNVVRGFNSSDDVINAQGGNDILWGLSGDDWLRGEAGNDELWGGDGDDRLLGGTGDDTLVGGTGDDVLNGGTGTNVLTGGEGRDRIHVSPDGGIHTVTDFRPGEDQLVLQGGLSVSDLTIHQDGTNTVVDVPQGGSLILVGVNAAAISSQRDILVGA